MRCEKHCVSGYSRCIHNASTLFHKEQHENSVCLIGHLNDRNVALPWSNDMTIEPPNNRMTGWLQGID